MTTTSQASGARIGRACLAAAFVIVLAYSSIATRALAAELDPSDYPDQSVPDILMGVDDYFSPMVREGNIIRTTTILPLDHVVDGQINVAIRRGLTTELIQERGDHYDFIMLASTFPVDLDDDEFDASGRYWHVSNDVAGIGREIFDDSEAWGSAGKLQGFIDLGQLTSTGLDPQSLEYRHHLNTAMHEFMHRWSSYVRYEDDAGNLQDHLLGHMDAHWDSALDSQASVMYGHDWILRDDGEYESAPVRRRYSDLDLYLAGFLAPEQVDPLLLLTNPQSSLPLFPEAGLVVSADPVVISVQQIVDAEGPRAPDVEASQKHFRAAIVLASRPNEEVPTGYLAAVEKYRRDMQRLFASMTRGQAILHVAPELQSAISVGLPSVIEGSQPTGDTLIDEALALDWVEQNQGSDGMWRDRNGSRWRDTASAMEILRLLRPDAVSLDTAVAALLDSEPETLEARAWHAIALAGVQPDPDVIGELASRQASSGGWGLTSDHEGSVQDTARILSAFRQVLPPSSVDAGFDFIADRQNPDGSWSSSEGGKAHFPTTLTALEALSLPGSAYSEARDSGTDWVASTHEPDGRFRYEGEVFTPGDTARALGLLIGSPVSPELFTSTSQWLASRQGVSGDWSGSVYATSEVLGVLGRLELPNLDIVGAPAAIPAEPVPGAMVGLTARIVNAGRQATPETTVRWYEGDPRTGGIPISGSMTIPALAPGSSVLVSHSWQAGEAGLSEIWLLADDAGTVEEWTREDNYGVLPLTIHSPPDAADLALHPDSVVVSPASIETLPVEVSITGPLRNLGLSDVAQGLLVLQDSGTTPSVTLAEAAFDVPAQGESAFALSFEFDGTQSSQLTLTADPHSDITDANRQNNSIPVDLDVTTGIDVAVSNLTLQPEDAQYTDRPLSIELELSNLGLAPAPPFSVSIDVLDDSGANVATYDEQLSLDALGSTQRTFQWQADEPGAYTLSASADPSGTLDDLDPTNNEVATTVNVTSPEGVNLLIDPLSVSSTPDPGLEEQLFEVSVDVRSNGGMSADPFSLGLYDSDPSNGGQLIGEVVHGDSLAPGNSASLTVSVPSLPLRGERTLWLEADAYDDISETNENDNLHAFDVSILGLPDLTTQAQDLSMNPAIPVAGQPAVLEARIRNTGGQDAEQVVVELHEAGDGSQSLIGSETLDEIPGEGFATVEWAWEFGVHEGADRLRVLVDPDEMIVEQDATNNQAELGLASGIGPLYASNRHFSPDGDGIRDDTLLVFDIASPQLVDIIIEGGGDVVRRFTDISGGPIDSGQVTWDGSDPYGLVVPDGNYLARLVSGQDELGSTLIGVDTDRSPLVRAHHQSRLFHNRVEGFRQGNHDPVRVVDPALGPAHVVLNPYNTDLLDIVPGVFRTGVRNLEPIISNSWIQDRSTELGATVRPVEVMAGDNGTLAIEADYNSGAELWLTAPANVDQVTILEFPDRSDIRVLGFDPQDRVIVISRDSASDVARLHVIDPRNGSVLEGPDFDWGWFSSTEYVLMSEGVLVEDYAEVDYTAYAGGTQSFPADINSPAHSDIGVSDDGKYATIHVHEAPTESVAIFDEGEMSISLLREASWEFRTAGYAPVYEEDSATGQVEEVDMARRHLGVSWSPVGHKLALVDGARSELLLWTPDSQDIHDLPENPDGAYHPEMQFSDSTISHERTLGTVQGIGPARKAVVWDEVGSRFMTIPADLVEADTQGSSFYQYTLIPGRTRLMVFDTNRLAFDQISAGSRWPHEGQTGNPIVPGSDYYGFYFPEAFPVSRMWWWSGRRPHPWLVPLGPYHVAGFWSAEAGYELVEDDCPELPGVPASANHCLPIPVINLDRAVDWIDGSVIGGDLDLGGFSADRNMRRWRIDIAPDDGLDPWRQIVGWTESEVVDDRFLQWPPDVSGPVLLRLQSEDRAGNRHQAFRRLVLPLAPVDPVLELLTAEPRTISPNGDGVLDVLNLEYLAMRAEPFVMRTLDLNGSEIFSQVVNHLPGDLGEHVLAWSGQATDGGIVPDGEYDVELWRYSVPVKVDTAQPVVDVQPMVPPFHVKPSPPGDYQELPPSFAQIAAQISDQTAWEAVLESRLRAGSLEWSEFRVPQDWRRISMTLTDYLRREFRIRATDEAGNETLLPIGWPGDYLVVRNVLNRLGQAGLDASRQPLLPAEDFNDPDSMQVSASAQLWIDDTHGLRIQYVDMLLERLSELHVELQDSGGTGWTSYEVQPEEDREGIISVPIDQLPGESSRIRLRNGDASIISNILEVDLRYIGDIRCYTHEDHADLFPVDGAPEMQPGSSLIFWQAFDAADFQTRELVMIRPGQSPEILQPVATGVKGARAYRVPDSSLESATFIDRVVLDDGEEISGSSSLDCSDGNGPGPIRCYSPSSHSAAFDSSPPDFDPATERLLFWRPGPVTDFPLAVLRRTDLTGPGSELDPVMTGIDNARLYLVGNDIPLQGNVESVDGETWELGPPDSCNMHEPHVIVSILPAGDCSMNAGQAKVQILPPSSSSPVEYAHVYSELETAGGAPLEVLLDVTDPVPMTPGPADCPRREILSEAVTDLSVLPPGEYRITTMITGQSGDAWEIEDSIRIYPHAPDFHMDAPPDQGLVCLNDGAAKIPLSVDFLDSRPSGIIATMTGDPATIGSGDGHAVRHPDTFTTDSFAYEPDGAGTCEPAVTTPINGYSPSGQGARVPRLDVNPVSPEYWRGQVDLELSNVDLAGGRSCRSRQVRIDSRVEAESLAVAPTRQWSRRLTPMLTHDGADSLREIDYVGSIHESLDFQLRVHAAVLDDHGVLVPDETVLHTGAHIVLDGPANPQTSPRNFQQHWDGLLDSGPAPDGFYFLKPVFSDVCRDTVPEGGLVEVDSTPPEVVVETPHTGQVIQGGLLEVVGSIEDPYFDSYTLSYGLGSSPASWISLPSSNEIPAGAGTLGVLDVAGLDQPGVIRIEAIDRLGNESETLVPVTFDTPDPLVGNFEVSPSVFSPNDDGQIESAAISYMLDEPAQVDLVITDTGGQPLAQLALDDTQAAGGHTFEWSGRDDGGMVVPDETYRAQIHAVATDDPGHEASIGRDMVVDTTSPSIMLIRPESGYSGGTGLAEVQVDDLHLQSISYELTGDDQTIEAGQFPAESGNDRYGLFNLDDLEERMYSLTVTAQDRGLNRGEQSLEFTIDRTEPEVTLISPLDGQHLRSESDVGYQVAGTVDEDNLLRWEVAVSAAGPEPVWQVLAESDALPDSEVLMEWHPDLDDGDYLLRLLAVDQAGNRSEVIREIVVDGTSPEAGITQPAAGNWYGPEIEVTGTADDAHLAIYELDVAVVDGGEVTGDWSNEAVSDVPVGDDVLGTINPDIASGELRVRLAVVDRAGNETVATRDFKYIDMPPPPPHALVAGVQNQQDVLLQWQAPNHDVPVSGYQVYRNGQKLTASPVDTLEYFDPGRPEGGWHYSVSSVDAGGNEGIASAPVSVDIVLTAPTTSITRPESGDRLRGQYGIVGTAHAPEHFDNYHLTAQPQTGPVISISESSTPVQSGLLGTLDTRVIPDGTSVVVTLEATDTFSNTSQTSVSVVVDNLAPAAPEGLVASVSGDDVQLSWDANSEGDLLGYLVYRNGEPVNWSGTLPDDLRQLALPDTDYMDGEVPDGQHEYRVFAIDEAGNVSEASDPADVTLDLGPPDLAIVEPLPGHVFDDQVRITAESVDIDLSGVEFAWRLQGTAGWTPIGPTDMQPPYRVTWVPGDEPWDSYEIRALATDEGGLEDPDPPVVTVDYADVTPPQIPAGLAAMVDGAEVSLTWHEVDDGDTAGYFVYRSGTPVDAMPIIVPEMTDTVPGIGQYEYAVTAVDEAGNESDASASIEVLVHRPELDQPWTPTPDTMVALEGLSEVDGTITGTVDGPGSSQSLPNASVEADVRFNLPAVSLVTGDNHVQLSIVDSDGNTSLPADVEIEHHLPPLPPTGLSVTAINDVVDVEWDEHTDSDIIGFRVFSNGDSVLSDESGPAPVDAIADHGDGQRAFDGDPDTAWGDDYYHCCDRQPMLEVIFDSPILIAGLDLEWADGRHAVDYDLLGWSGNVWSPLARIRDNESPANSLMLPRTYRTDRLRLRVRELTGSGYSLGLVDFQARIRPLLDTTEWQSEALLPGIYRLAVSAVDDDGFESDRTEEVEVGIGDVSPPEPVTLQAQVDGADVSLDWSENTTDSVSHYSLRRDGEELAQIAQGMPRSHVDAGLANGTYTYVVHVVTQAGVEGPGSDPVSVTIDTQVPGVPLNLAVTAPQAGGSLEISWEAGPGPDPSVYRLRRSLLAGGPYEVISEQPGTSMTDAPLENDVTYFYTVEAVDSRGNASGPSDPVSGTPRNIVAPPAPEFSYPGHVGEMVSLTGDMLSLLGTAQPGSIVDMYRGDVLIGSVEALAATDISHLADFNYVYDHLASPRSRWAWLDTGDGERIFDTLYGGFVSLPYIGTDRVTWNPANGRLWRRESLSLVHTVDPETGESEPLDLPLATSRFVQPAPDGQHVLIAGRLSGSDPLQLYLWDRGDDSLLELASVLPDDIARDTLAWTPDSSRVAWVRDGSLHVLDPATDSLGVHGSDLVSLRPVWSPDSVTVAVSTGSYFDPRLQVLDTDTGETWLPDTGEQEQRHFIWNPDASRIAFMDGRLLRAMSYPSGDTEMTFDLDSMDDYGEAIGWQRPLEFLVEIEGDLERIALPGWFRMDGVAWIPGVNPVHATATDTDGNRSVPSGEVYIQMGASELPDLAVTDDDLAVQPSPGQPGDTYSVTATVSNIGEGPSTSVQALMMLVPADDNAQVITQLLPIEPLAPGGETALDWEIGTLDDAGLHEILFEIDPLEDLAEVTRDNNVSERNFVVGMDIGPQLQISLENMLLGPGSTLNGEVEITNPVDSFNGSMVLEIRDAAGNLVAGLPGQDVDDLAGGETFYHPFAWDTGDVVSGEYDLIAHLFDATGAQVAMKTAHFGIQLQADVSLSVAPGQPVFETGEIAEILVTLEVLQVNGVITEASLDLFAEDQDGMLLEQWQRQLGTLLAGYESAETIDWELEGVPTGTHRLVLELSSPALFRSAVGSMTVVDASGPGSLSGNTAFVGTPLVLGNPPGAEWNVQAPGDVGFDPLPLRLRLVRLDDTSTLDSIGIETTLPPGSMDQGEEQFDHVLSVPGDYAVVLEYLESAEWQLLDSRSASARDAVAPVIDITQPVADAVVSIPVTLRAEVSDVHSAIDTVEYRIDGTGPWEILPDSGFGDYARSLSGLGEGAHEVVVRATDSAGNLAVSPPAPFTVDNTPPQILVTGVGDGDVVGMPVTPIIEIMDIHPNSTQVTLNGTVFSSGTEIAEEGMHILDVQATDQAGNTATLSLGFELDFTAPDLSFLAPAEGAELLEGDVDVVLDTEPAVQVRLERGAYVDTVLADNAGLASFEAVPLELGENTLVAIERAAPDADMIELDVRRCGSGELVAIHDPDLDRVTGATGRVADGAGDAVAGTVEEAVDVAESLGVDRLYVLGGGAIYELFQPHLDRMFLSRVPGEYEGDTVYPDYDEAEAVAEVALHELDLLEVHRVALRLGGLALLLRAVVGDGGQLPLAHPTGRVRVVQPAAELAVDHQVRVAADGAREVRVVVEAKPIVADIVGGVDGLRHRLQCSALDDIFLGPVLNCLDQVVEVFRLDVAVVELQLVAEEFDVLGQFLNFFGIGAVVDAVDERLVEAGIRIGDVAGNGAIRQQHELLDQPVGLHPMLRYDVDGVAFVIEDDLDLQHVEVDGAFAHAFLGERAPQPGRRHHVRGDVVLRVAALDVILRAVVREALFGVDDRLADLIILHVALRRDLHNAGVGQLVFLRAQRAHLIRQLLRQHRDRAVDEVDARAALQRFLVDGGIRWDVVAHVRDVDAHLVVPVGELLDVNGVVEVLGVHRIDGEGGLVAQVQPPVDLGLRNGGVDLLRFLLHGLGEIGLYVHAHRQREHAHIRVRARPQHAQDLALRRGFAVVKSVYRDDDFLAIFGAVEGIFGHKHVLRDPLVVGVHKAVVAALLKRAHDLRAAALDDFQHFALAQLVGTRLRAQRHPHDVAMQGRAHVVLADEELLVVFPRLHEAEALRLHVQHADGLIVRRAVAVFAAFFADELLLLQTVQDLLKTLEKLIVRFVSQRLSKLVVAIAGFRIVSEKLQDVAPDVRVGRRVLRGRFAQGRL